MTLFPWEETSRVRDLLSRVPRRQRGRRAGDDPDAGRPPRARPGHQHAGRDPSGGGGGAHPADLDRRLRGQRDRAGAPGSPARAPADPRPDEASPRRVRRRAAAGPDHRAQGEHLSGPAPDGPGRGSVRGGCPALRQHRAGPPDECPDLCRRGSPRVGAPGPDRSLRPNRGTIPKPSSDSSRNSIPRTSADSIPEGIRRPGRVVAPGGRAGSGAAGPRRLAAIVRIAGGDTVPVGPDSLVLHRVGQAAQGPIDTVETGPRGRFEVRFHPDTSALFLFSVRYEGIEYFSAPIRGLAGKPDTSLVIIVADTSSSTPVIGRGAHPSDRAARPEQQPDGDRLAGAVQCRGAHPGDAGLPAGLLVRPASGRGPAGGPRRRPFEPVLSRCGQLPGRQCPGVRPDLAGTEGAGAPVPDRRGARIAWWCPRRRPIRCSCCWRSRTPGSNARRFPGRPPSRSRAGPSAGGPAC